MEQDFDLKEFNEKWKKQYITYLAESRGRIAFLSALIVAFVAIIVFVGIAIICGYDELFTLLIYFFALLSSMALYICISCLADEIKLYEMIRDHLDTFDEDIVQEDNDDE